MDNRGTQNKTSPRFELVNISVQKRAELLDGTRWSNEFIWDDLQAFAQYIELFKIAKGTTIFAQGDRELFMGLILKGSVNILKEDSQHHNKVLTTIGKDKTLGEMALIDGQPRSASAITAEDTVMFVLTKDKFEIMADKHPKVWGTFLLKLCKLLSQRLRETSGELVDYLGRKD
ncbi:MAG: cyclic nucleotide-binding domain-containing protein [Magnetococcales bacterium]|nr:cyclic nucleotide-binding domain-containing protein [Magnetococcales bacterium]